MLDKCITANLIVITMHFDINVTTAQSKAVVKELLAAALVEVEILPMRETDEKVAPLDVQLRELELKAKMEKPKLELEHRERQKERPAKQEQKREHAFWLRDLEALQNQSGHHAPSTEFNIG